MANAEAVKPAVQRARYGQVFAVGPFRALFGGTVLTIVASSLQMLGLSVLVYLATGSAWLSAVAYGAGFLPQVLGGVVLTSLADRLHTRPLIVIGCLIRAAVAVVLGLAPVPVVAMIGLVAAAAALQPLFSAAQSALLPHILTGDRYVLGRSVLNLASAGAQLAGLGAGGVLIAVLGGHRALLGAAAAQLLAGFIFAIGLPARRPPTTDVARRWRLGDTWRGNAQLLANPSIRAILLLWWIPPALLGGAESLVVPYVAESGAPPASAGWVLAAMPAGMFFGDLIVGRFCTPATRERLVLPLLLLMGLPLLPLVAHLPLAVTAGLLGVASAGFAYQLGRQQAFLDAVPEQAQGLAFGLYSTGIMTGQGLGPIAAGAVASTLNPGSTMALAGSAIVVASLLLGGSRVLVPGIEEQPR
jgi:predicted MFS family arabinose efflux permease